MDSAPQASCWSSYNHYDGPGSAEHGHCFLLSVILDAGTWNLFAGVRIILVFHETEFASHDLVSICNSTSLRRRFTFCGLNYRPSKIVMIQEESKYLDPAVLYFTGMSLRKDAKLYVMGSYWELVLVLRQTTSRSALCYSRSRRPSSAG